jgi:hypothetical protein
MPAKLALRRHFLDKYHSTTTQGDARVLDCCQGSGMIWNKLREEYPIEQYWGLDVKPKKGRLTLASERLLAQTGWSYNVIDIDTYGSPWNHWEAMLGNLFGPATVFLTFGNGGGPRVRLDNFALRALGILPDLSNIAHMSGAITHNLAGMAVGYCLGTAAQYGKQITECVEAVSDGNARYIGVRIESLPVDHLL